LVSSAVDEDRGWLPQSGKDGAMTRNHQPDQADFRVILPEDVDWKPFPAFPPGARLAVVVGHPTEPGPYVVRVKVPNGTKLMPHKHPEDRIYTVMSGVFYIGLGETFDGDKVNAYPPGSVLVLPGETWHFHWAKSGEYVTQVTAIGPLGLDYHDPHDDPRHHHADAAISPISHRIIPGTGSRSRLQSESGWLRGRGFRK
jgi:quercetin dioxygenase-like cupin family protein